FSMEQGGVVINAAIGLRAKAEWTPGASGIRLEARDLGKAIEVNDVESLDIRGPLALAAAAIRRFPAGYGNLRTECDAPPGSGLGSSGAVGVALVAALQAVRGEKPDPVGIAEAAWRVEAVDAGFPGGRQDQWAAALGGFNRFTFRDPAVTVEPLEIPAPVMEELERRIVLCYTGTSRVSSRMISRVVDGWQRRNPPVVRALHGLVETAGAMAEALGQGDLARIGDLLDTNWSHQQALDKGMRTDDMARLEHAMRTAGALGGKAAGAGAGGCMFFLAGGDPARLIQVARALGTDVFPVSWDSEGVKTC
ncbi:MAG: hypothetical protein ACREL6_12810, partial [Gemmatimonadales bacterium]